jgi:nitrilase
LQVSDFPPDYPPFTKDHHDRQPDGSPWVPEAILSHGGSCVVGPLGTFVAKPIWDKEDIVYADLNMDDLVESRVRASVTQFIDKRFSLIARTDGL